MRKQIKEITFWMIMSTKTNNLKFLVIKNMKFLKANFLYCDDKKYDFNY